MQQCRLVRDADWRCLVRSTKVHRNMAGSTSPLARVHNIPTPCTSKHCNDGKANPAKCSRMPSTEMYTTSVPPGRSRKRCEGPLARSGRCPAVSWPGVLGRIFFELLRQCRDSCHRTCAGWCGPCGQRPA